MRASLKTVLPLMMRVNSESKIVQLNKELDVLNVLLPPVLKSTLSVVKSKHPNRDSDVVPFRPQLALPRTLHGLPLDMRID